MPAPFKNILDLVEDPQQGRKVPVRERAKGLDGGQDLAAPKRLDRAGREA